MKRVPFDFSRFVSYPVISSDVGKTSRIGKLNCSSNELWTASLSDFDAAVMQSLMKQLADHPVNQYVSYDAWIKAFSQLLSIPAQELQLFAGSDDAIKTILCCFSQKSRCMILQTPNYDNYRHYATLNQMDVVQWGLGSEYSFYTEDGLALFSQHPGAVVVIASPNGFTGKTMSQSSMSQVIEAAYYSHCIVILDQAYGSFAPVDYRELAAQWPHIVVLSTFSKGYGMAGARFAYCRASEEITKALSQWNGINAISIFSFMFAAECLRHGEFFASEIRSIVHERELFARFISSETPWFPVPSCANFLLLQMNCKNEAKQFAEFMWDAGVSVKTVDRNSLENCVRISIRSSEDMHYIKNQILSFLETR